MISTVASAVLAVFGARRMAFLAAALGRRRGTPPGPLPRSLAVVMPARNEAAALAASLERLAAAEPPSGRFSVVLVDHDSEDATRAIMERFASAREGWTVLRSGGPRKADAVNTGLAACADAELVAVCDADVRPSRAACASLPPRSPIPGWLPPPLCSGRRTPPRRSWRGIARWSCGSTS